MPPDYHQVAEKKRCSRAWPGRADGVVPVTVTQAHGQSRDGLPLTTAYHMVRQWQGFLARKGTLGQD